MISSKLVQAALVGLFFISCNSAAQKEMPDNVSQFDFVSLSDLQYQPAEIAIGTEVEILANLGGPGNKGDTVYYYQFIVLNKTNGDTIRILCPEITVQLQMDNISKTSSSPLLYDHSKGVNSAIFELVDSTKSLLLNAANMDQFMTTRDSATIDRLLKPGNEVKVVVLDKDDTRQRIGRFKTVVGVLNFKAVPWNTR